MKLQLALDLLDEGRARQVVRAAAPYVDIVEIGTSLLKLSGIGLLNELRPLAQGRPLFVDAKIIDGPAREAELMGRAGADAYSMLAVATDTAVSTVLERAAADGAEVVFDLQSHPDPLRRAADLQRLGATSVCVHKNPDCGDDLLAAFDEARRIREETGLTVTVAGGITAATLARLRDDVAPAVAVIGGSILDAPDPASAAASLREVVEPLHTPDKEHA